MSSNQEAGSTSTSPPSGRNFLDLPIDIRYDVYTRVLHVPHPLYLFREPGCPVETFAPEKPIRWLALLSTNHQIHREASAALYKTNQFHLMDTTQQESNLLQSFLDCIGPVNAASLSHLCISFPAAENIEGQPGQVKLREDSLQSLKLLQDQCAKLSTLEMIVHSKNSSVFRETDDFLQGALLSIDAQFKAIPSLKRIVVRATVHDGVPSASAKDFMRGLGWILISDSGS
ncbi:hypothetical protein K458DRAFT_409242 [Lentithecium fluviatile CBS 122367]|uniref:Uncharacterized protein n=1 Tax=Lentithecium fluviatile CBS 122367 TaxID=1168545 RepID=A0A6G1IJE9_9PLEO|nr:hypothetical protein K458DRAFT_409242 [Lentithecium fluviatile CBS 122367]